MLLAAGKGTRLQPFTNEHPKALFKIGNSTLLKINIQYLQKFGINDIVINVHHFADQIESYLQTNNNFGANIIISNERDQLLETGGGLWKAQNLFNDSEDIMVLNSDMVTDFHLAILIEKHLQDKPLASLCVSNRSSSRVLVFDEHDNLKGWRNLQTNESIGNVSESNCFLKAFNGLQIINRKIFSLTNFQGKFSLMDVYMYLCTQTNKVIKGVNASDFKFVDAGKWENIKIAEKIIEN